MDPHPVGDRASSRRENSLGLGYRLGTTPFGMNGLSHGFSVGLAHRMGDYAWVGLKGGYGTSSHEIDGEPFRLHSWFVALLAGMAWEGLLGPSVAPFIEGTLGHQWLLRDDGIELKGDPISVQAELRAGILFRPFRSPLELHLSGGITASMVTVEGQEQFEGTSLFETGMTWRF